MKTNKRRVILRMKTRIVDASDAIEKSEAVYDADFYKKGDKSVWIYRNDLEEGANVNNVMTLDHESLSIKRRGDIETHQRFIVGKQTEMLYKHPYGQFAMVLDTKQLVHQQISEDKTQVILEYDMIANGEKRHFTVRIESMEVPS